MAELPVKMGQTVTFSKTVTETDVVMFAGISGDFAPPHTNAAYMETTSYGQRIAHGALLVGYMSTASTMIADGWGDPEVTAVSLGYDGIRFVAPVFFGDTVAVKYTVAELQPERMRAVAEIEVTNQRGEVVAVAKHIIKWVKND